MIYKRYIYMQNIEQEQIIAYSEENKSVDIVTPSKDDNKRFIA